MYQHKLNVEKSSAGRRLDMRLAADIGMEEIEECILLHDKRMALRSLFLICQRNKELIGELEIEEEQVKKEYAEAEKDMQKWFERMASKYELEQKIYCRLGVDYSKQILYVLPEREECNQQFENK